VTPYCPPAFTPAALAASFNPGIASVLPQPMIELIKEDALLGSWILDRIWLAAESKQIDVNADQLVRMRVAHSRGSNAAPIATLHRKALVAEGVRHQLGETIRQLLDAEALLPGPERQAIARQRRRYDGEGVGRIAAELCRIGETRN